jgi:hypothetical protein
MDCQIYNYSVFFKRCPCVYVWQKSFSSIYCRGYETVNNCLRGYDMPFQLNKLYGTSSSLERVFSVYVSFEIQPIIRHEQRMIMRLS